MNSLRSLKRGIVHHRMKMSGIRKINKKGWFSRNWKLPEWWSEYKFPYHKVGR